MFRLYDRILNRITMYRLTLYVLTFYVATALVLSLFGLMPFGFKDFGLSLIILITVCWITNKIFAYVFSVPVNVESHYITAFILSLIILPAIDNSGYMFLAWAGVIAIASKYILVIRRKHIFNPAALAVVATFYILGQGASWWVGNMYMQILLIIGGMVIVRKIRRWNMVFTFLAVNLVLVALYNQLHGTDAWLALKTTLTNSYLIFFATIMFTEPATTPPTNRLQLMYGALVAFLASPYASFSNFYFTPELALVVGNMFSFMVSQKSRLVLTFLEKKQIGRELYEFVFASNRKISFRPGQYLEWTLAHKSDTRGNRRYFTIASSPTESNIHLGVKFHPKPSSFKKSLIALQPGSKLMAGQLAGDFVLPQDLCQKLVFIAGGIGITPYRSMLKYLVDNDQKRDIILFYSNRNQDELVYKDVLDLAQRLGVRVIYTLTGQEINGWTGESGRISPEMISIYASDYISRTFYISGTQEMVFGMEQMLKSMGIPKSQIRMDFFPGF